MAKKPLPSPLPADLPENWTLNQVVSPNGTEAGLDEKHGYNYKSKQINAAQKGINVLNEGMGTKADLDSETMKVSADQLPPYQGPLKDSAIKDMPVDADSLALVDSADSGKSKRVLWSKVKAALKGWFDTLYATAGHMHTAAGVGADPAGSAAAVDGKLTTHAGDTTKHVTAAERTAWNAKETPTGAQAKADAARDAAKAASVPTTRKVNGKALTSDITLTAPDVGALPTSGGTLSGDLSVGYNKVDFAGPYISNSIGGGGIKLFAEFFDFLNARLNNIGNPEVGTDAANKEYVDEKVLVFRNKSVSPSSWVSDTTYSAQGYIYRAAVACTGVTANHVPTVAFSCADAVGGNFAPVADSYAGGVYLYCKTKPTATVTIPSIVCVKGA